MFDGCGASEKLNSVVCIGNDFDVFQSRSCTYTSQCQTIDLIACTDVSSSVANRHVCHRSTAVFVLVPSVSATRFSIWNALDLCFAGRRVQLGLAQNNHATPLAANIKWRGSIERVCFKSEHNGSVCCSVGLNLPPPSHHQGRGIST